MNFGQRVRLAWNIAINGKANALLIPTWQEGTPSYSEASFESLVRHGWRKNELIFACVSKTAASASFVELRVKRKRDDELLDEHPLAQLIRHPNPYMDAADLWYSVVVYQKLAGVAYFEKERDRAGRVIALWPLRPDWMKPIRSSRQFISGYEYTIPGNEPIAMRADDVLDFRLFDPLNQYRGYPPVAVAGRVGDVDNATTDYLMMFMEKGGMPPGLLKTKQKLLDTDVSDIRRRWSERYGGAAHWLEPAVLDSDAEYQQVGMSFHDMGFDVLDARSEARICMVLDIPPILVGAKVGIDRATYSNYEQARKAWWEDVLVPLYRNYESVIGGDLAREYGEDIYVEFEFANVPALQESEDAQWGRANEGLARGYITINEARAIVGLDDIGEPGEIFLRPSGHVEVDMNGDRVNEPVIMEPAVDEEEDPADEDDDVAEEAARYLALEAKAQRVAPDDDERRMFEARLRRGLEEYFAGQLERIEKEIDGQYKPVVHTNGDGTANE